jgi:hypothetical protein
VSSTAGETGPVVRDGTGAGLIAFLNWTITHHELVETTASALRTGCQKVLSVEDDPDGVDLRSADLDSIIGRFKTKHRYDMKERTREQYEQRFRQSVEMYLKRLNDDPTWKPAQRKRPVAGSNGGSTTKPAKDGTRSENPPAQQHVEQHQPGMISYPFPIRPGLQGKITLPEDLTMREANRIAAFVATLALEDEVVAEQIRAITAGSGGDAELA